MNGEEIKISPRAPRLSYHGKTWPGRNHPGLGTWLCHNFVPSPLHDGTVPRVFDPFFGVGALWRLAVVECGIDVSGCEIDEEAVEFARLNYPKSRILHGSAENVKGAGGPYHLIGFSPMFPQAHPAGNTDHQKRMMHEKKDYAIQGYRHKAPDMNVIYRNIAVIPNAGPVCVILRNRIKKGVETTWVQDNMAILAMLGYRLDLYWRRVLPTRWQQAKIKRDSRTPYIDREWVVVARR